MRPRDLSLSGQLDLSTERECIRVELAHRLAIGLCPCIAQSSGEAISVWLWSHRLPTSRVEEFSCLQHGDPHSQAAIGNAAEGSAVTMAGGT